MRKFKRGGRMNNDKIYALIKSKKDIWKRINKYDKIGLKLVILQIKINY